LSRNTRARPSGHGDAGRARPSDHGDAGRGQPVGHGDAEAEGALRVEEARAGAHVRAVRGAGRHEEEERRWVRETREVKASPQRAHKRCNQPGRKETGKIGVPWVPGFGCFKVRASQPLGLGQCSKQEKLQPESAAGPSGHLRKRALDRRPPGCVRWKTRAHRGRRRGKNIIQYYIYIYNIVSALFFRPSTGTGKNPV
jgi:hypothetical protein